MGEPDVVIRAEGLGKRYEIRHKQTNRRMETLRDVLASGLTSLKGVLTGKGRTKSKTEVEQFWALKNAFFEVKRGEVVGIIGRNGAGKSTLLKILSRITEPTTGRVAINGRVASLLEVGTGFHPELTGRENIFLNGAILGMQRGEIRRKFDDIVDFAQVARFLDTPVKHYSSGMYVRLAFAVAAHLEPEILIVDEVLAVGDAAFQKKCLGKMGEVVRHGRTIIFVSHNMPILNQLCPRAIQLHEGQLVRQGPTAEVVAEYLSANTKMSGARVWENQQRAPGDNRIRLHAVRIRSEKKVTSDVPIDRAVEIEVDFWNLEPNLRNICVNIYLLDSLGNIILSSATTPGCNSLTEEWFSKPHPVGMFRAACSLPANFLNEGRFLVNVYLLTLGPLTIHAQEEQALTFSVYDTGVMREPGAGSRWDGVIRIKLPWQTNYLEMPEQ